MTVIGRVTLDGNTLNNAKVEFIPIDGIGTRISTRTDHLGHFNIQSAGTARQPGVKIGKYKISITTFVESDDVNVIDYLETVPTRYNKETTLTTTVSGKQDNRLNFDLSTK